MTWKSGPHHSAQYSRRSNITYKGEAAGCLWLKWSWTLDPGKAGGSHRGWCGPLPGGDTRGVGVAVNALEAGLFIRKLVDSDSNFKKGKNLLIPCISPIGGWVYIVWGPSPLSSSSPPIISSPLVIPEPDFPEVDQPSTPLLEIFFGRKIESHAQGYIPLLDLSSTLSPGRLF